MRSKDFLLEKTLSPRDFYKKARLELFINRLKNKQPFINDATHEKVIIPATSAEIKQLRSILPQYDAEGNLPTAKISKLVPNVIGGVKLSTLFKDKDIGGLGGVKGDDKTDPAGFNIGPAIETWKAIGIFAKLIHRKNTPITINELMSIKNELEASVQFEKKSKSDVQTAVARKLLSVPDIFGLVKDTISIKVDVGLGPWQRAMKAGPQDPNLWGRIQGIVTFLNENKALARYSRIFATNRRSDPLKVAVVGGAGKKTDVRTSYLDPATDYKQGKQIVGMSFSLKAGNASVAQSPGTTNEGIGIMFDSLGLSRSLADQAIVDSKYKERAAGGEETQAQFNARLLALQKIMHIAAQHLDTELKTLDNNGEKVFLKHYFGKLKNAVTAGEGLIFVEFNAKGTYDYLNPHTLNDLVEHVDLEAKLVSKKFPYIYIYDKNSGSNLAHIRLEVQKSGRLILKYELDDLIPMAREASLAKKTQSQPEPQGQLTQPVRPAREPSLGKPAQPALKASQKQMGQEPQI
jgi:hypothetical protein